ncbi:MAG: DUF4932 domain-containing protein [Bacteroidia bacterium]|jgi:hypothetical protein|nr:DUF4932 domain-containing protein [Bacteroidia bacterium]
MKTLILTTLLVAGGALTSTAAPLPQPIKPAGRLVCLNDTLWLHSPELNIKQAYRVSEADSVLRFNFGSINKPYTFGISNGKDDISFRHSDLPRVKVEVSNGKRSVNVYMTAFMNPESKFTEEHKLQFNNQVVTEVPEVYELTNILLSLTPHCRRTPGLLDMDKPYYKEVQQHFAQFEGSPLVDALSKAMDEDPDMYLSFRNSGFGYMFKFDELVETPDYKNFNGRLGIRDFKLQIEDFAKRSGFRRFYAKHKEYYGQLVAAQNQWVNLKDMKSWLEQRYPNRFNAYRVVLSPLAGNQYNVNTFESNKFSEAVMFVYAFDPAVARKESAAVTRYKLWQIVFNEIAKAYIQPVTDTQTASLNTSVKNVKQWNTGSDYHTPYETFNVYMTNALLALYMNDHMNATDFTATYTLLRGRMENERGFVQFGTFADEMLAQHRKGVTDANTLHSQMMSWMQTK